MRVLLGAKAEALTDVRLPTFASFKLDGWRGIWQGAEFFSRTGKTIPNRALQRLAKAVDIPPGWDGEIIVGQPNAKDVFRKSDSFCKRMAAPIPTEGVKFFVFDNVSAEGGFDKRKATLSDIHLETRSEHGTMHLPFVVVLNQILVTDYDELAAFEQYAVEQGYEGIVCRSPTGKYKQGRSTLREQYLVKVKRYIDEECKIIGFEEKLHNANPAYTNEVGYTKRSSHQAGKIPAGTLGSVIVDWRGKNLHVGTGFDAATAKWIWSNRDKLLGQAATIKYSPVIKDLPRQPVWKGLRDKAEM